ncbi:MAG: hypothetical protein PHE47_06525 [Oscillospiraceae bacterium]|nr:hypothetical protein [Oscillospiraceae bacterium]
MLWIAILSIVGCAVLCGLQAKIGLPGLMLAVAGDDSDMKIVPPSGTEPSQEDAGEKAAQEFVLQKENGNINKAYALGKRIACVFFEENGPVATCCEISLQPVVRLQRKILFAFVEDAVLNATLPSVLAETASQEFSAQVQQTDPSLYEKINDSKTLSYYLLCAKNGRERFQNIGEAFALLCGEEENAHLCSLGDQLYQKYSQLCSNMIEETAFC